MEGRPPVLKIGADELARAELPAAPAPRARVSQLAVASFVLGLLGLPLVGLLLGPVAICCGLLALGAMRGREALRGFGLAVAGTALGVVALVAWTVGLLLALSNAVEPLAPAPPAAARRLEAAGIADAPAHIRRALESNVVVRCRGPAELEALGSGVVVARADEAFLLLTNRHVAECGGPRPSTLTAATPGAEHAPAERVWSAPEGIDAVLLRVKGPGPAPAARAARAAPRVGDGVFVVGNPLGYETTYTAGVLSATRTATWGAHRLRVFQVQASVNSGNSGGGLYDASGNLIGLVTWAAEKQVAEGLGFAIATDELFALVAEGSTPGLDGLVRDPPASGEERR